MFKPTPNHGWSIGHCNDSLKWMGSGTYTEKCCISGGLHILSCKARSHGDRDWSNNILTMLGHQFCNDFVGHNAFIVLNVTGTWIKITIRSFKICINILSIPFNSLIIVFVFYRTKSIIIIVLAIYRHRREILQR